MSEKKYYTIVYDEEYYIFDSSVISKDIVEEEAEYSYDVFANSMSSDEIVDLLNKQDENINLLIEEVKYINKQLTNLLKENEYNWEDIRKIMKGDSI